MINNYAINNNSINTAKRNQYVDFVRGILIFFVVLGHSIQHIIYHESGFENNFLFKIIYSFHMPLFILIGGYLTYPSLAKRESTVWLKKRLLYLFVPTITWSIIVSLFTFAKSGNYSFSYFINYLFNVNWFITAMLVYSITFTILKKFNLCRNWILISLAIIFIVLPVPIKTLKVVCSFYPFFIMGYLLACNQVKLSINLRKVYILLILIVAMVGICFWNKDTYVYYTPTDISYTGYDLYRLVVGCAVIIIFTLLSKTLYDNIKSKRITTSIVNTGKDTFAIYLIQTAFFYKISSSIDKGILIDSIIACLFSLSVFLWPYVIDRISDKSKICGLILFGKKVSK